MMSREQKANTMAMAMVPAKGKPGMVIPKAMAMTAPRDAPEDTPRVDPSARGFFKRPCMAPPQRDKLAPTSMTARTRGSRDVSRMAGAVPAG